MASGKTPQTPSVACPQCESTETVKLQETLGRIFYFCFSCGKGFITSKSGAPPEAGGSLAPT